jgi:glycosyltransferase involved in cell wall biosynthesis
MKLNQSELFIGVTSWNSEQFLPICLTAIAATTKALKPRVVVIDNTSSDKSPDIAREFGAELVSVRCSQADALNRLVSLSCAKHTLLIHSDVVLLSERWYELCAAAVAAGFGLVSPEDIGCGPWSRPFGRGKPESSFMFFANDALNRMRRTSWRNRFYGLPVPKREVDFYGDHVTHGLPTALAGAGSSWSPMRVHISTKSDAPYFKPSYKPDVWTDELGALRYGLGNFYSVDGTVTHYHNWYDRCDKAVALDSTESTGSGGRGFPKAFIRSYSERFIDDYRRGYLVIPTDLSEQREPVAL